MPLPEMRRRVASVFQHSASGTYSVHPQPTPPQPGADTTFHLAFDLAAGDPQILNNHLRVDPAATAGALTLAKNVNRAVAAVGALLQYRLSLANAGTNALAQIEIADRLPPGLRYRSGSLRINDAVTPDPALSADGRTLTIRLAELAAGGSTEVRYVAEAPLGITPRRASSRTTSA